MDPNLLLSLQKLNLGEKEARVYLSLLRLGEASAYNVAKHSGLKRPTAYVILDTLITKGLVRKKPLAGVVQFNPINPDELFRLAQERLREAMKVLPELQTLAGNRRIKTEVSYYDGMSGIKEMYRKAFAAMGQEKEIIGFYAHGKNAPQELVEYWETWAKEKSKRGITARGFTPKHSSTDKWIDEQRKHLLEIVALPQEKYSSDTSIEVYRDYTAIISSKFLQGVLIDNPDIAKTVRQIFNLLWENKPNPKE